MTRAAFDFVVPLWMMIIYFLALTIRSAPVSRRCIYRLNFFMYMEVFSRGRIEPVRGGFGPRSELWRLSWQVTSRFAGERAHGGRLSGVPEAGIAVSGHVERDRASETRVHAALRRCSDR